jgi:hypothetical protein
MTPDFFDRLEAELGTLTRRGTHLGDATEAGRDRRLAALLRRGALIAALAVALAASLVAEFPASAGGRVLAARVSQASIARGL